MSFKSWKREFYKMSASTISRRTKDPLVLIEHSLNKWTGLLPENLQKHDVVHDGTKVFRKGFSWEIYIDSSSCSLCMAYYGKKPKPAHYCEACPIFTTTGETCGAAFSTMRHDRNPKPMVELLHRVGNIFAKRKI